jgi:hypothetical protein
MSNSHKHTVCGYDVKRKVSFSVAVMAFGMVDAIENAARSVGSNYNDVKVCAVFKGHPTNLSTKHNEESQSQAPENKTFPRQSYVDVKVRLRIQHDEMTDPEDVANECDYSFDYTEMEATIFDTRMDEVEFVGRCNEQGILFNKEPWELDE